MPVSIKGSGGGSVTLDAGAAASDTTLTLPNTNGTVINTAPGTAGNVLTSNGSAWTSAAPTVAVINTQTFASSGTWTKPAGYAAGSRVMVQCWGGGASGGKNNGMGGGGGGYNERWLNLSQMGATETITIGAGGAGKTTNGAGNAGGTTTVGSLVSAYGGGGGAGTGSSSGIGGAGGGQLSAGETGGSSNPSIPGRPVVLVDYDTGSSWRFCQGSGSTVTTANLCDALFHGGGGAGQTNAPAGNSVWGGGGGGGCFTSTAAGTSQYAGNGGAGGSGGTSGTAGTAPSGGGGGTNSGATSGAGAAGQVIITVFPA